MRIGVMSDTHGNLKAMQQAADVMVERFKVDAIIHLGDDYKDVKTLNTHGRQLIAVPGIFEDAWEDGSIKRRMVLKLDGITFLISHTQASIPKDTKEDINPALARSRYKAQVLLHGHSHKYAAAKSPDGLITINPGHLKGDTDRNSPPTFAVIETGGQKLNVQIVELNGALVGEFSFDIELV